MKTLQHSGASVLHLVAAAAIHEMALYFGELLCTSSVIKFASTIHLARFVTLQLMFLVNSFYSDADRESSVHLTPHRSHRFL